jgi:hypothetical protein
MKVKSISKLFWIHCHTDLNFVLSSQGFILKEFSPILNFLLILKPQCIQ